MTHLKFSAQLVFILALALAVKPGTALEKPQQSYIIRGLDTTSITAAVNGIGGNITHELNLIQAVAADLDTVQLEALRQSPEVLRIYENGSVRVDGINNGIKGDGGLKFSSKKVKWKLKNLRSEAVTIDGIYLRWPQGNQEMEKIRLNGKTIYHEDHEPGEVLITDDWHGSVADRTIKAGKNRQLEIHFDKKVLKQDQAYTLVVAFDDGTYIEFFPENNHGPIDHYEIADANYPALIGADEIHADGVTGAGVTIAFIDSGFDPFTPGLAYNAECDWRVLAAYDAIADEVHTDLEESGYRDDDYGHATHLQSLALSSRADFGEGIGFNGVAPGADLVSVKAFQNGMATYGDIIRGIDWVLNNKNNYDIKVLNLSFSATPRSHYWDDPINLAVMTAWQNGILVVTSAGNTGPDPMTIGVPGIVPYILTVGAMSDNFTPGDLSDDFLASFSSVGPTPERFVKPDIVAPGGHMMGIMSKFAALAQIYPEFHTNYPYFEMSGTSQATAVVSGVAALLLEQEPWLTPDDIKCRLMAPRGARSRRWFGQSCLRCLPARRQDDRRIRCRRLDGKVAAPITALTLPWTLPVANITPVWPKEVMTAIITSSPARTRNGMVAMRLVKDSFGTMASFGMTGFFLG